MSSFSEALKRGRWRFIRFASRTSASVSLRGDDEVYPPDALPQLRYLRAAVAGAGEVARHPAPDVLRLADVDDLVLGVLEDVDAGGGREVGSVGVIRSRTSRGLYRAGRLPSRRSSQQGFSGACCGARGFAADRRARAGSCRPRRPGVSGAARPTRRARPRRVEISAPPYRGVEVRRPGCRAPRARRAPPRSRTRLRRRSKSIPLE